MNRLEQTIAIVLKTGVFISSASLALGMVLSLLGVAGGGVLLQIGMIVLLCTPVARVIISTVEYIAERDWRFATLTMIVLLELLASAVAALVFNRNL